jgi:hypothetical protein
MSYTITRTNGTTLGTIADGTFDNSRTSLTLVGRNFSNYGQIMTDNLVRLLENSSYNISPSNPLSGQLWWNSSSNLLNVYSGTAWKVVGSATSQSTAPVTTIPGDFWFDNVKQQLYVYNGTNPFNTNGWVLVGPSFDVAHKTGAIVETITDTLTVVHYVISMYVDGARTAIVSKDSEFVPVPSITGISVIRPGYNQIGDYNIWGTADNANNLGTQPAANFFRNNQNNTGTGILEIVNDSGLTVGVGRDLTLRVNGINAEIVNNTLGGNISVFATVGGTVNRYIHINGSTGQVEVAADPTSLLGIATKQYVDDGLANSPSLGGVPTAPTATQGDSSTQIATTEFVYQNTFTDKIQMNDSHFWISDTGTGGANLVIDGTTLMIATASGVDLKNGAVAVTQTQTSTSSGNARIATTQFVKTATQWWGGSAKFVSTVTPTSEDGEDGDFWFQITS